MSASSIFTLLLLICLFKSNFTKVIDLDLNLPFIGKSRVTLDTNKIISDVKENRLNSNEMKAIFDVPVQSEKKIYKTDKFEYEKHHANNEAIAHPVIENSRTGKDNEINIHNEASQLVSSIYKKQHIQNNSRENDQTMVKTDSKKEMEVDRINKNLKMLKNSDSSEFDIRAVAERVNITNITESHESNKSTINNNFKDSHSRRKGYDIQREPNPNTTNTVKTIRERVPISDDIVDVRLYSHRKVFDMGNRDSLALYDLKMQSPHL